MVSRARRNNVGPHHQTVIAKRALVSSDYTETLLIVHKNDHGADVVVVAGGRVLGTVLRVGAASSTMLFIGRGLDCTRPGAARTDLRRG